MVIFAGHLGPVALGAHNILLQIIGLLFLCFPLGISGAVTVRVGNFAGAGDGARARRAAVLAVAAGVGFQCVNNTVLFLFRDEVGRVFTSSAPVVSLVARLAPIACIFSAYDGFQGVCGGSFRGLGWQDTILKMNLFSFWAVGVPVGWWLCFRTPLGVFGLWWGLSAGLGTLALLYAAAWVTTDWEREAQRIAHGGKPLGGNGKSYRTEEANCTQPSV